MKKQAVLLVVAVIFIWGCASPSYHKSNIIGDNQSEQLTVGKVQHEIKVGMSSADVAQVLGSPNVVTTDEQRREVWVYDKIATDVSYSNSQGFATLILIGTERNSGASSTSQRTLTVIVKFDEQGKVRDFAYHSSKF